jgi:hypothetical protein
MGDAGRLRPRRSVCDEEAQLTPLGKRASWSGSQLTHTEIATMYTKTGKFKQRDFINKLLRN